MFPKYSEVVKMSLTQIIANHLLEEFDNATIIKIHAEFLSAMNVLIPNGEVVKFELDKFGGLVEVKISCGSGENDYFSVGVEANFETQQVITYVV